MRFMRIAVKEGKQLLRRPLGLALALLSAPALILVYWLIFAGGPRPFRIACLDRDGSGPALRALVAAAASSSSSSSSCSELFSVSFVPDEDALSRRVALRDADIGLILPQGFSAVLASGGKAGIRVLGDASNPRYPLALAALEGFARDWPGEDGPVAQGPRIDIEEEFLGSSGKLGAFDLYVPGLLVISLLMALFPVGLSLQEERASGGLRRLRMSGLPAWELGLGMALAHLCVCAASFALAFGFARLLGFRGGGEAGAMFLAALLTALGSIGVGLAIGSAAKDGRQVFLIGFLPFVLLALLSGAAYPMPRLAVLALLPSTHAVRAMHLILIGKGDAAELGKPMAWLAAVSAAYYLAGLGAFALRYRREGKAS